MQIVLGTNPSRTTRKAPRTRYIKVQITGKFKFVDTVQDATVFPSAGRAIQALGIRARRLSSDAKVSSELVLYPAQSSGVTLGSILNG